MCFEMDLIDIKIIIFKNNNLYKPNNNHFTVIDLKILLGLSILND